MLNIVTQVKYRLSHISAKSWHWRLTTYVFEKKARGKACTYYWFKIPASMIAVVVIWLLYVIFIIFRGIAIGFCWLFGFTFTGNLFELNDAVDSDNLTDYKVSKKGTKQWVAPWEILLIPVCVWVLYWLTLHPQVFRTLVIISGSIIGVVLLIYMATYGWKLPYVVAKRREIKDVWNRVCPPLVVEEPAEDVTAASSAVDDRRVHPSRSDW